MGLSGVILYSHLSILHEEAQLEFAEFTDEIDDW